MPGYYEFFLTILATLFLGLIPITASECKVPLIGPSYKGYLYLFWGRSFAP